MLLTRHAATCHVSQVDDADQADVDDDDGGGGGGGGGRAGRSSSKPDPSGVGAQLRAHFLATVAEEVNKKFEMVSRRSDTGSGDCGVSTGIGDVRGASSARHVATWTLSTGACRKRILALSNARPHGGGRELLAIQQQMRFSGRVKAILVTLLGYNTARAMAQQSAGWGIAARSGLGSWR